MLLQAKELDVVGAVVGAYCLLKTGGDDRFREWPKRLADLYSWLPDVHVIHAWQLLDEPGAPEFAIAERRLLQAESTGLPVFSAGLQRLYDGLLAFRDDPDTPDDQPVHDAASRLKPYVASASIQHTYSTYYGASPSEPNVEPVLGELPGGMEIGVDADA